MTGPPSDKITPMLRQYLDLKDRYADALVLFQMGDFYETFFGDAETAAQALNITLTSRSRQGDERIPMAGFPIHAAASYIPRLLEQGFKVVVCDQMEDPAQAKGLVRREVTRILTRGTVVDPAALAARTANYLAAVTFKVRLEEASLFCKSMVLAVAAAALTSQWDGPCFSAFLVGGLVVLAEATPAGSTSASATMTTRKPRLHCSDFFINRSFLMFASDVLCAGRLTNSSPPHKAEITSRPDRCLCTACLAAFVYLR